ncbi:MAG: permease prefix domain 1-containing protein [Terrisporobacter sp.]|uniref:permease prefix domain 1-containing protein n=1 Tax=Terrisporobacter sp. TaxID=1965305 RepID=UPI002FCBA304
MKIIDNYLNILYKNDDSKEAQDLREELTEHLITSANEFIKQGYDLDSAQKKAIEQFDDGEESSVDVRSIYIKKIDMKKAQLGKLYGLRWKVINVFGVFLMVAFFTANYTSSKGLENIFPIWLKVILAFSFSIVIIVSVLIFTLKRMVERD